MTKKNEIGFNTRCEKLKSDLINNINQSNLPIGTIYYIMKTIMSDVESTYYGVLNSEAQEDIVTTEMEMANND